MSATFKNLMIAIKKIQQLESYPLLAGASFFYQIENAGALDNARKYYFHSEASEKIFDWVAQYRAVMSFCGMPIPFELENTPFTAKEWTELTAQAEKLTAVADGDYILDRIDTWLLESYSLKGVCEVEAGDVVLDCGTYTGNTSLYFSQKTGPLGHVYGFEASNTTFKQYARNMGQKENVTPVHSAVCGHVGTVSFSGDSCGSAISDKGETVPATTLDAFFEAQGLKQVDFIKMDIEGAEADALLGARDIIRKFRPKMAISAYHKEDDLVKLPLLILSLSPYYDFELRHFSDNIYETVLYCIPAKTKDPKYLELYKAITQAPESFAESYEFTDKECIECFMAFLVFLKRMLTKNTQSFLAGTKSLMASADQSTAQTMELVAMNKELAIENAALKRILQRKNEE